MIGVPGIGEWPEECDAGPFVNRPAVLAWGNREGADPALRLDLDHHVAPGLARRKGNAHEGEDRLPEEGEALDHALVPGDGDATVFLVQKHFPCGRCLHRISFRGARVRTAL